uniref:Uncharacterized protein n=1 Tax=Anguilla anguilla TaxID=7936 RepID=A0A0E9PYD0_ANGAN
MTAYRLHYTSQVWVVISCPHLSWSIKMYWVSSTNIHSFKSQVEHCTVFLQQPLL